MSARVRFVVSRAPPTVASPPRTTVGNLSPEVYYQIGLTEQRVRNFVHFVFTFPSSIIVTLRREDELFREEGAGRGGRGGNLNLRPRKGKGDNVDIDLCSAEMRKTWSARSHPHLT